MGAFFIAFAIGVFVIAARPSVKQAGIVIAAGNVFYTVASPWCSCSPVSSR